MTRAFLLLPALLLCGCVSLLPKPPPPPTLFVLEAGDVAQVQHAPVDAVLGVASPDGERTMLGTDMVWRSGDSVAFVAQSAWTGRAEDLLANMLVGTVREQGIFRAVVNNGEAASDYQLRWTVQNFEIVESSMNARFSADVIVLAPGRRVLATERINAEAPVSARSPAAASQALTRAAREGSARIGLFAADAVAAEMTRAAAEDQARAASISR